MIKKICSKCKVEKLISEFTRHMHCKGGFRSSCKDCERQYVLAHKEQILKAHRRWEARHKLERAIYRRGWRAKLKVEVLAYYSGLDTPKCINCGIDDVDVLTIDHIKGGGNRQRKATGVWNFYWWIKKNGFPEGYQTLCANCNLKKKIQLLEQPVMSIALKESC